MAAAAPAAYAIIINADPIPIDMVISDADFIKQALFWIGFELEDERDAIMSDAFTTLRDITVLSEDDIKTLSHSFASRTAADGRLLFGLKRTKYLKGLAHFIQDFYRISKTPSINGLSSTTFRAALDVALQRSVVRTTMIRNSKLAAEAANPGKLDSENNWKKWEERFNNYLNVQLGTNGIALSYIIRENDVPDTTTIYPNFMTQCIKAAPLTGEFFIADTQIVFHMIINATTGCASADWIKSTIRYSDGRRSWKKLVEHFAGEGSASKALAEAEHLFETLHYKNERAMSFENFLTKCQKMFNIFDKQGEPMGNDARVRFLFKHVQHPELEAPIEALKVLQSGGEAITYTRAANHLSTHVSNMKERFQTGRNKLRRQVAGIDTDSNREGSNAIYDKDGNIITDRIENWHKLSMKDKKIVFAERKRLGVKGPSGNKQAVQYNPEREKQLADSNKKHKRTIKALKKRLSKNGVDDSTNEADESDDDSTDPGDAFGGKNKKKSKS